ncbi:MAG TPA: FUSC family protein [Gemmatimonadales bacterium]|nr:FUSC family protein [Gemmatimonadales bacterium]
MAPLRRALDNVRAATVLEPVRPAWGAGLRVAIATVVPLAVAQLAGLDGGTWLSLAGFTGALADKGGPTRHRATAIGALAIAGACGVALGTLAGTRLAVMVPLTFAVALACGLARVWGDAGTSVGGSVLNMYVIALAFAAPSVEAALGRAGLVLIGGLWAMLVALVLWPLRPYRQLRLAVAELYRALAAYTDAVAAHAAGLRTGASPGRAPMGSATDGVDLPSGAPVRLALEAARRVLAAARRGRAAQSERGERFVVLREVADQLFGHTVALAETIDAVPPERRDRAGQAAAAAALTEFAATARRLADAVEEERGRPTVEIAWSGAPLQRAAPADPATQAAYAHAAILVDRLAQYASIAAATVGALNEGGPAPAPAGHLEAAEPEPSLSPLAQLRAVLAPDSLVLRHSLRLALVTTAAVWLTSALALRRGYWVTITAVIILQPYVGLTSRKALQRVLGTIVGGVLAAILGAVFRDPVAILPVVFVFAAVAVALLPLNYAAFSVFLTPTFVLLAEASAGDWHLAEVRILNTVLGGALALLGARLLWPSPESGRVANYFAAATRANREYLRRVAERFGDRSGASGEWLRAARRDAGLAVINAEESFQRLLAETRGPVESLAPLITFLTYSRRLTASIAALALARFAPDAPPPEAIAPFAEHAAAVLDDIARALVERRPPAPLPPLHESSAVGAAQSPLVHARLERLARQLRILRDSAARGLLQAATAPDLAASPADARAS